LTYFINLRSPETANQRKSTQIKLRFVDAYIEETGFFTYFRRCGEDFGKKPGFWLPWGQSKKPGFSPNFVAAAKIFGKNPVSGYLFVEYDRTIGSHSTHYLAA
jgi:hypothetical protein